MKDLEQRLPDLSAGRYPPPQLVTHRGRRVGPTNRFRALRLEEVAQTIPERFEEQVAAYPERIAVKTRNAALEARNEDGME